MLALTSDGAAGSVWSRNLSDDLAMHRGMVAIHEQYTREMYEKYGYFATWLPSTRVELGDVGTFSGHRFDKVTTLSELGVAFQSGVSSPRADLEYSSSGAVSVTTDGALGVVKSTPLASVSITFAREGATYFQASECREQAIENLAQLQTALMPLCHNGTWHPDYVVVTRLVSTGPTMILISSRGDTRVELALNADGLGTPLPLAKAAGNFVMTAKSGLAVSVLADEGSTPLFRASQMRRRVLGRRELVFRGGDDDLDLELAAVGWDDVPAGSLG
ncbi:hypothetical protein [Kibdelosporangium philippinense]